MPPPGTSSQDCTAYDLRCELLAKCQEEFDDDLLGFCTLLGRELVGFVDDISCGYCDCICPEKKHIDNR